MKHNGMTHDSMAYNGLKHADMTRTDMTHDGSRTQRVVISGMGAVSPYGEGVDALLSGLREGRCALTPFDPAEVAGLHCRVAGRVPSVNAKRISREVRRTMSDMSVHACLAAWEALVQARLLPAELTQLGTDKLHLPRMGVAIGSTLGSPEALHRFFAEYIGTGGVDSVRSTTFFKVMSHSVASNVAMACQCRGRLLAPAAACASGLMGIGLGYESIRYGREERMLCGGADEFHALTAATFDRMQAASLQTDPQCASLPFHQARQGIVISEGAGVLLLERLNAALERGAPVLAEVMGYASLTSPHSIAFPEGDIMRQCMEEALDDAGLQPSDIGYVNAHATGTVAGDAAEGTAVTALWGDRKVPVSSLKGHMGHSLAASGALETIACVDMLRQSRCLPTLHLDTPDPHCGALDHITSPREKNITYCIKNSFAMGGVYCSLVLGLYRA